MVEWLIYHDESHDELHHPMIQFLIITDKFVCLFAVVVVSFAQADVMATVAQSAEQGTAGIVIWGDHLTEKTKTDCLEIKSYIDNFLGPLVKNLTAITQTCSQKFCNSHGRCTFQLNPSVYARVLNQGVVLDLTDQWKFVSCKCYNGWSGGDCSHQV